NVEILGYNSRLDTIQAAILLVKLNHLEEFNRRRQAIARFYSAELAHLPGVVVPGYSAGHVFHQFTIRCRNRDRLAARLRELGIATMVYYPVPLHRMKVFEGRCRINGPLTQTERACQEVLSLPIEPLLEPWELERVVQAFREAMETIDN
ncbi:MAG: DegT/DnrJ/EryC1/StrS family aminotransferase, partial [candidate division WOR-3 bacterium]